MVFEIGDRAAVGPLVYTVLETNLRTNEEQSGGLLVRVRVTNTSPDEARTVPPLILVDDDGQTYTENGEGAGLPDWMGGVRRLEPTQSREGVVFFAAPVRHYRLRVSDPVAAREVSVDVPVESVGNGVNSIGTNVALTAVEAQRPRRQPPR